MNKNSTSKRFSLLALSLLIGSISPLLTVSVVSAKAFIGATEYADLISALSTASNGDAIELDSNDTSLGLSHTLAGSTPYSLTIRSKDGNIKKISGTGAASVPRGGAIYSSGSGSLGFNPFTLSLSSIQFDNFTANDYGGAIAVWGVNEDDLVLNGNNIIFSNNKTTNTVGGGGAIYSEANTIINASNVTFSNNQTAGLGGAIRAEGKTLLKGSNITFSNNKAQGDGGAIYSFVNIELLGNQISFTDNQADHGGALRSNNPINIAGNDILFKNNTATSDGGAIQSNGSSKVSLSGKNIIFWGNTAGGTGGAINITRSLDMSGENILFYNNIAGGKPNSINFGVGLANTKFDISSSGYTLLLDPITSEASGNMLNINKTGSGFMALGGDNVLASDTNWNINAGTLTLTRDSADGTGHIHNTGTTSSFNLNNSGTFLIAPDISGGTSELTASNVTLAGTVGVGNDIRYAPQITYGPDKVLLDVTTTGGTFANSSTIASAAGTFSLGMYDYQYENLHWDNMSPTGGQLVFGVTAAPVVNPSRSGGYSVRGPISTVLNNKTNDLILYRIPIMFERLPNEEKRGSSLWATPYFNQTKIKSDGIYKRGTADTPGIIVGLDRTIGSTGFFGGAISGSWPEYEQGNVELSGHDTRFMLYGGANLAKNLEWGAFTGLGLGNGSHSRILQGENYAGDFDTTTYTVGTSLARPISLNDRVTLRPFAAYEYLYSDTGEITETGNSLGSISIEGHDEDISRLRAGAEVKYQLNDKNYLSGSLYWLGQYGNTTPSAQSWYNSHSQDKVTAVGGTIDENNLGVLLTWSRSLNVHSDFYLSYRGLFGEETENHYYGFMFNYKF